jgi:hypothetical protein
MNKVKGFWQYLVLIVMIALCVSIPWLVFRSSLGNCFDPFSGHVPDEAMESFIRMVIEAALKEDYVWIASVSTKDGLDTLKANSNILSEEYIIKMSDELAGIYEYNVYFNDGKLHLTLSGIWPQCPDFNITEDEIIQNIRLRYVK